MHKASLLILCLLPAIWGLGAQPEPDPNPENSAFVPLHIYIDSGDTPLAAYQFELKTVAGRVKIVGVEGGDHPAFSEPPYYDPAALANDRIIIAAFNTGSNLPAGKTRMATLHLLVTGDTAPEYDIELSAAADPDGQKISAQITFDQGDIQ